MQQDFYAAELIVNDQNIIGCVFKKKKQCCMPRDPVPVRYAVQGGAHRPKVASHKVQKLKFVECTIYL